MEAPGAEERFTDAAKYAFDADANDRPQHKRNSLAALKDIVAGRKDWWEKKAGKTGAAGGRSKVTQSVTLPNMATAASQGRPAQGLLFSLAPPDASTSPTSATAPTAKTPTAAVHQSLPQLRPPQVSLQPDAAPTIGRSPSSASSLKRMLSRLTGRSPKAAAAADSGSPAPSPLSPAGSLPLMAYSPVREGTRTKAAPFGSPAASCGGGADDTCGQHPDQGAPDASCAHSIPSSEMMPCDVLPAKECFEAQADIVSAASVEQSFSANEEFSPSAARCSAAADASSGSPAEVQSAFKVPATVAAAAAFGDGVLNESVPFSLAAAEDADDAVDAELQQAAQAANAGHSNTDEADHGMELYGEEAAAAEEEECFADPEDIEEVATAGEAVSGDAQHDALGSPLHDDAAAAACARTAEGHASMAQPEATHSTDQHEPSQQQLQPDLKSADAAGDTAGVTPAGAVPLACATQPAVDCAEHAVPMSPAPTVPLAASPAPTHVASPMLMSPLPMHWGHGEEQAAEEQAASLSGPPSGEGSLCGISTAVPAGTSTGLDSTALAGDDAPQAAIRVEEEADAMMMDAVEDGQEQDLQAVSAAADAEAVVETHVEAAGSQLLAAADAIVHTQLDHQEQQVQHQQEKPQEQEQGHGLMEVDAEMETVQEAGEYEPRGAECATDVSNGPGDGSAISIDPAQSVVTEVSTAPAMPHASPRVPDGMVATAGAAAAVEQVVVADAAVAMPDMGMDLDVDMEAADMQAAAATCPDRQVAAAEVTVAAVQAESHVAADGDCIVAPAGTQQGTASVESVGGGLALVQIPSVSEASLADLEAWMHGEGLEGVATPTAVGADSVAADTAALEGSETAVGAPAAIRPFFQSTLAADAGASAAVEAAEVAAAPLGTSSALAVLAPAPALEATLSHASPAAGPMPPISAEALSDTLDLAAPVSPLAVNGTLELSAPVSPLAYGAMMDLTGPISPLAYNSTLDLTAPVSPLTFNPTLDLMSMDEGGQSPGFGFAVGGLTTGVPPLESTPSPVAQQRQAGQHVPFAQAVRDSIPLFGVQQSISVNDSVALDRLSLDDIAPFSRKKAPQHPAMDTLMEQPGDFMCSPSKELSAPGISDSPTLPSQCSPAAEPATAAAAAFKPIAPAAPAVPAAAATPAPVSGRTYGMAPGSARAAHGLRGGGGGVGGAATPAAGGGTGAQLSGRARGGVYAPLGGAGGGVASAGGAAPATPANAGSSISSRSRGVYGAGMGSAVKGGKATGAADLASTPLTQQAAARRPAVSSLKKPAPTTGTARAASAGGATPSVSANAGGTLRQMRITSPQVAPAAPMPLPLASPVSVAAAAASPAAVAAAVSPAAATPTSAALAMSPALAGPAPQPQLPSSWATPLAQMAALPLEAALHAPLGDHSPFLEDWASGSLRDSSNIAEEARKLFSSLATTAPALPTAQLRTPAPPAGTKAFSAVPMPSPSTVQMLEMQMGMMVQKLADAESRLAVLEKENEGLRDQLATVQFQSGLTSEGAEDLERQARECAEEQLAVVTARLAVAEEAAASNRREADAARDRGEELVRQLEQQAAAHSSEVAGLKAWLSEASHEREAACAQAESLAAQLSSKGRECDAFQSALQSEQRRVDELQAGCKAQDAEVSQLHKANADTSAKLQKALESLTTTQVNQRKAAAESEGKTAALSAAMTRMQEDRNALSQQLAAATSRAKEAEAQVAQLRKDVAAGAAENKELLTICNQLLSQVEKTGGK